VEVAQASNIEENDDEAFPRAEIASDDEINAQLAFALDAGDWVEGGKMATPMLLDILATAAIPGASLGQMIPAEPQQPLSAPGSSVLWVFRG
jgi:hypothetical protein